MMESSILRGMICGPGGCRRARTRHYPTRGQPHRGSRVWIYESGSRACRSPRIHSRIADSNLIVHDFLLRLVQRSICNQVHHCNEKKSGKKYGQSTCESWQQKSHGCPPQDNNLTSREGFFRLSACVFKRWIICADGHGFLPHLYKYYISYEGLNLGLSLQKRRKNIHVF